MTLPAQRCCKTLKTALSDTALAPAHEHHGGRHRGQHHHGQHHRRPPLVLYWQGRCWCCTGNNSSSMRSSMGGGRGRRGAEEEEPVTANALPTPASLACSGGAVNGPRRRRASQPSTTIETTVGERPRRPQPEHLAEIDQVVPRAEPPHPLSAQAAPSGCLSTWAARPQSAHRCGGSRATVALLGRSHRLAISAQFLREPRPVEAQPERR